MKKLIMTLYLLPLLMFALPAMAKTTDTFEGWMQGINCVIHGHKCPVDTLDPHLAFEPDFVLYLEGGDYFILPNIDRTVKAKYVHDSIRVIGTRSPKYQAIDVDRLEVMHDNSFKTVWSKKMVMEEWKKRQEEFYGAGGG